MTMQKLRYISEKTLSELEENVEQNLDRYVSGNFHDLATELGWNIELPLDVDLAPIAALDPTVAPETEVKNSLAVWSSLSKLAA